VRQPVSEPSAIPPKYGIHPFKRSSVSFTSQASSSPIPMHILQYPYFGITIETAIQGFSLSAQRGPTKERKWTGHWVDARARADNVRPCVLHFGHSTTGHAALGYSPQRQMTSIPTTPSVSPKPTPASEPASAITQLRHVVVVCAVTHSDVRVARCVGRIPPRTAPTGVRDGDRAAEAGHCEGIIIVLCLTIPVIVRARSQGLRDSWGKD